MSVPHCSQRNLSTGMTAVCENHFTWAAGFGEEKTFVGFVTSSVHLQGGL